MTNKSNKKKPLPIAHLEDSLLKEWFSEIEENPHFSNESFRNNKNFISHSKKFLTNLLHTIDDIDLPDISLKEMDPFFTLWRQILKEQSTKGFSTKETAMLVFSLKSSLISQLKKEYKSKEILQKFNNILDFLGLFTFELYASEKEQEINQQKQQIEYLQTNPAPTFSDIIGNSPAMMSIYKSIGLILENDITVLLEGESGTGKDLVAQVIHKYSKQKKGPFISINCGAIPNELIESELFGYEKGAFTGADSNKIGKIELAQNGTLFLDEIGELPLNLQVKLLRFIQNKEIEKVGSHTSKPLNIRIIAATNKHLKEEVKKGSFRLDLYYRLCVFPITTPPLRERETDIILLAEHFLALYSTQFNITKVDLSPAAKQWLLNQTWEGNIRELQNVIQRALILSQGHTINREMLTSNSTTTPNPLLISGPEIDPLETTEKQALIHALSITKGNIKKAAEALGISRTTFYNKAKKYTINLD